MAVAKLRFTELRSLAVQGSSMNPAAAGAALFPVWTSALSETLPI